MAGSGALGFGGGFAKGFANALIRTHQEQRQDEEKAYQRKIQGFQMTFPIAWQNALETGDFGIPNDMAAQTFPMFSKYAQKQGSPFEAVAPILKAAQPLSAQQTQVQQDQADALAAGTGTQPELPSRQSVQPSTAPAAAIPDPHSMFLGMRMPTPEERARRTAQSEAIGKDVEFEHTIAARRKIAQTLGLDPSETARYIATGQVSPERQNKFVAVPYDADVLNVETGAITDRAVQHQGGGQELPAEDRARLRELKTLHPDWTDEQIQNEWAKDRQADRDVDRQSKLANAESIRANRAIQHTLLQMQADQGGITPNNAASLTVQLRRDWQKATQPFKERQTYVGKLNEMITPDRGGKTGIQRDRNVATQTIINSFNRLLEEQNTVREGEYARSEELTPLTTWLQAQMQALQSGGGKLTDAQLESIAREGIRIANVTASVYEGGLKDLRTATERQLGRYNIPAEDVFGNSKLGKTMFSATLNGTNYSFDSQAKLDAFKRKFPDAK